MTRMVLRCGSLALRDAGSGMAQVRPEPPQSAAVQRNVRGRFDVFISHAGAQKNFALWVRSHVRICGYRAFVDERDLRCGLV